MTTPMIGTWSVELKEIGSFTIHGDLYYELRVVRLEQPEMEPVALRVPQHAIDAVPAPGDKLTLSFLMGQVTSATKVAI